MKHAAPLSRPPPGSPAHRASCIVSPPVWDIALLRKYAAPGPLYTAYPTTLQFSEEFDSSAWEAYLRERPANVAELSLDIQVPPCPDMDHYRGGSSIFMQRRARPDSYLASIGKEMKLLARFVDRRRRVTQLHWSGDIPGFLGNAGLTWLMHELAVHFSLDDAPGREYSVDLDPRATTLDAIALLKGLGFNHLRFSIGDIEQEAKRTIAPEQTPARLTALMAAARGHRVDTISFDLAYGFPGQDATAMTATLREVMALSPERITLHPFSQPPQESDHHDGVLRPDKSATEDRLILLRTILDTLGAAGYVYLGMDQLVKPDDRLAQALQEDSLHCNRQGYSARPPAEILGLGVSAISRTPDVCCQNLKSGNIWEARIAAEQLPVHRGLMLSADDRLRRDVITQLMCSMGVDLEQTAVRQGGNIEIRLADEFAALALLEEDGLVHRDGARISVTAAGRLLLPGICRVFHAQRHAEPRSLPRPS